MTGVQTCALPIFGASFSVGPDDLLERPPVLRQKMKFVVLPTVDRIELSVQHRPADIRREDSAAYFAAGVADDQLVIPYLYGFLPALLQKSLGFPGHERLAFGLEKAFGQDSGVLQVDFRKRFEDLSQQS